MRSRTLRPFAVALALAIVLGPASGLAWAKSDITLTATRPASGPVATSEMVDVYARGADDAGGYQNLCVDRRIGAGPWHRLACSPVSFAAGGSVREDVPVLWFCSESFRARLFRVDATGGHPALDRASTTVTVQSAGLPAGVKEFDDQCATHSEQVLEEQLRWLR